MCACRRRLLLSRLNELGKANGIGRLDLVENRFVGMKSRGVYETPGGTILLAAHRGIESITLDREAAHLKDQLMPRYAELIYNGFWFSPERRMLQALIDESQKSVTGTVRLKLYKGNATVIGRRSPQQPLFDAPRHFRGGSGRLRPGGRARFHQAERAPVAAGRDRGAARRHAERTLTRRACNAATSPAGRERYAILRLSREQGLPFASPARGRGRRAIARRVRAFSASPASGRGRRPAAGRRVRASRVVSPRPPRHGRDQPVVVGLGCRLALVVVVELRRLGAARERRGGGAAGGDRHRHGVEIADADLALVAGRGIAVRPRRQTRPAATPNTPPCRAPGSP